MKHCVTLSCGWVMAGLVLGATTMKGAEALPDFDELRQLIQTTLPGVTRAEIDRQATEGLLRGFRGKVQLLTSEASPAIPATNLTQIKVFEGEIAYLRVRQVEGGLAAAVRAAGNALLQTNPVVKGLVLDLRFAGGHDYAAAAATADLFDAQARELLDPGSGMISSTTKTNAWIWPTVVLVNGQTQGAAEALAALVGGSGHGLVMGSRTPGTAMLTSEFTLKNGQHVRIATAPLRFGGKTRSLASGLEPDIPVAVSEAEERTYWDDPYGLAKATGTNIATTATNRVIRRFHTNEADLVRARREGVELDENFVRQRETEPAPPVLQDVVLGRAVDLLKGLALVRRQP
ncbi:MAG TPA: S41 family peptidase [Verrucomicrobiota bacterium]|nr:S41 family peptidase [Verrucomicrobiota bacterium]HNT14965.1 S41 family peptidase [Verrucomicrobiota bacterium]